MDRKEQERKTEEANSSSIPISLIWEFLNRFSAQRGMSEKSIEFREVLERLLDKKKTLFLVPFVCIALSMAYAFLLPPVYEAKVLVLPKSYLTSSMSKTSSAFLEGLGLSGNSATQDKKVMLAKSMLQSRTFMQNFIEANGSEKFFFPENWNEEKKQLEIINKSKETFFQEFMKNWRKKHIDIREFSDEPIIEIAVQWNTADQLADITNRLVASVDQKIKEIEDEETTSSLNFLEQKLAMEKNVRIKQELIGLINEEMKRKMLVSTSNNYVFHVIDPAISPERPVKPNKILLILMGIFFGIFFGMLLAFMQIIIFPDTKKTSE